ncbi:MAG: transcriptional regulator [Betaproteobacteria bacterium]|nr:transcriptional regulator [Betaproteobacteria bacterium]
MLRYGQFCPIAKASELLGEKWTVLIVRELLLGTRRFNDFQRAISLISPTVLAKRLKTLEEQGVVFRKTVAGGRSAEYHLTPAGKELHQIIAELAVWGMRWARGQMEESELDVELLMWDIGRRIDREALPGGRAVIRFSFPQLRSYRDWWVVVDESGADLCTKNPGKDVDLHVVGDLRALIEVWMCDITLSQAKASGKLTLVGSPLYSRTMKNWFMLNNARELMREPHIAERLSNAPRPR